MKKPPLPLLIAVVLLIFTTIMVIIYFVVLKEGRALDDGESYVDVFDSDSTLQYVEDPDIGNYPGVKKLNMGAEDFYAYLNMPDGLEKMAGDYKYFSVVKIIDMGKKEVLLRSIDTREEKTYIFDCSPDRVFSYKNLNFEFVSSGFMFIEALKPGNTVITKCANEECSVLGPDCIIRIEYKGR